jgi:pimeloyl-ACP methyl ester carboxylesterase
MERSTCCKRHGKVIALNAWLTATAHPNRVRKLVVLSVAHPLASRSLRQREMGWYQLFFQFEYRFENEQLLELINRTTHAAALT